MREIPLTFRAAVGGGCTVRVGSGVLDRLVVDFSARPPARLLVVVADSNVAPLYGEPLRRRLGAAGLGAELLTFPAGEASKTRATKAALEDRLVELGAGRDTAILAVGGGVTGDLAGFVAATWHRGIPLFQVPTSLLAMVDASIGGKVAVNTPGGKNLVGAFHQPLGVWADVGTLATLPDAEYRMGFAEVIKGAVIADAALFARLESSFAALLDRDAATLVDVLSEAVRIKGRIVGADERERGPRAALNFGHTIGHALEVVSGYRIGHGAAVSIGMRVEAELAAELLGFPAAGVDRLSALLDAFGLPLTPTLSVDRAALLQATERDKKARDGRARYALPAGIGELPPAQAPTVGADEMVVSSALDRLWGPGDP